VRAAARELGISHSAVSRHIAELERWLGVALSEKRRGLAPTPQAQRLATATLEAMQQMEHAADAVREQRSPHAVVISTAPSFAARWLLPRLPALERAHPRLEISVLVDQRIDDPVSIGSDIAIRMGAGGWSGVSAQPLMDDALYPVMSPALWEQSGRPRDLASLRRLRLLHDRDPAASWQTWRDAQGPEGLDVRGGPRYASSDLVLRAAAQGLGVALARHRLTTEDLASGILVRPFGSATIPLAQAYWIVTPAPVTRNAVKTLVAWLQREARVQSRA
jgi:LysR family glycine cleavage system transcriptional activator